MSPKKVWSIILIVSGVLFILGSISGYHDTSFYGNEIESMGRMMKKYGGKVGNEILDVDQYQGMIRKEKFKYILAALLGIISAIIGTVMLKNSDLTRIDESVEDEIESETTENGRWRL